MITSSLGWIRENRKAQYSIMFAKISWANKVKKYTFGLKFKNGDIALLHFTGYWKVEYWTDNEFFQHSPETIKIQKKK